MKSRAVRILFTAILALTIASVISWIAIDRASAESSRASSTQDIGAARAALGHAMAEHEARAKKGKNPEVTSAFRAYKAAVDERRAEIYERLRQLDLLIAEPPSDSMIDDPARSSYLNPRPEVSAFVAEYDDHRAELSALTRDFKSVNDQVNLMLGLQAAACPPLTTINGTLGSGSQDAPFTTGQQTGRILNGLGNVTCGSSNPCTLNTAVGLRTFDAYTFTNPGMTTACVTVNFTMTGCNLGQAMQFSARLGSFDPANPCANYVGDGGAGFSGEIDRSFSFNVPAGQDFVIVVNANDIDGGASSAVGCAYSLTISGLQCQAICPPATAINGTLGSGSQNAPFTTGQQTGRILNGLGNVTCGSSNPCTLNTAVGLRTFDAYTFSNPGTTTACVTVDWTMTGCNLGQSMQFSARIGSFDPANPCANYVGDGGAGFSGEADGSFSFNVPAGEVFIVVVNANDIDGGASSAVGCAYTLTISGIDCSGIPCTLICPSNITQPNDAGQCGAVVNFSPPFPSGDCGTVSCSPPSGSFFPPGTTTVTCTASTGPSCSFTVTVQPPPPTITCPANITTTAPPSCNQAASVVVNFPAPTASDVCGSITLVCVPPSGSSFPVGTTTVTCTATGAGGPSNCSFTVTVFGACLQDDSNPGNVVLFNTTTGEYRFCCNGTVLASGIGTISRRGCEFTIQHNTPDRRVLIKVNFATGKGTASIQSPPGQTRCTITDRNVSDNSCQCGGV